ncbi:F-box/LRR-repeat protein 4-like isoform X2 [Phragmites australis]|uniref:F-box/LRR-repeat protein 4-like isoform X2 n=1 Tax=Phragmites australis TaxID=29695 RepID=UPI002D765FFA|nr:F-box/LRR-repeat protein 4-like isoform X2 [Phragmites australis]
MRGADLINLALPDELLDDVLRRVGAGGACKRDLDACALVCRRWRRLERASRRSAKLAASGERADEVLRLVAERFRALVDVSVDERLTVGSGGAGAGTSASASRSRRPVHSTCPSRRRRRMPLVANFTVQISPFPLDQPVGDDGTERSCLTDVGLTHLARGCKGLEKLSLIWCSAISSTGLVRIAENCKNLTSLDLQACYIGDPGLIAIGEGCKLLSNLNLRFVEGTTDDGLIGLVKNCGQSLVSLAVATCVWMTDASLHAVGSHCPNLEILSLESDRIQNEGVISIAKGCRQLKNLKLQCIGAGDEALDAIGLFCSLLESLSLNNFERFTDRSLSSIAKARSCKKLARLKINGCQNMETAALEHIGRWCPGLLELSLIYCPRIQNSAFLEIGRGCSLLRSLYLVDCSRISDDAMCHIAQGCKNLKELSIRRGYEIGDKALISVAENCKLLRELTLQFCERVSDVGLTAVGESCSLQKLNLCGCQLITDSGLTAIARGCPDLVFLDISVLRIIGDMALAEIGEGCPKLKEIALSHCPEVTDVGLGHLIKGCLQLESCQMVYCSQITSAGVATVISSCSKMKKLLVEEWKVSQRTRRRAGPVLSFLCTGL